ncbi:MAG TPA: NFACT family protein [Pyrinomonadaceae bacterium]|jgi:predicted ribosome quality control (RQC) complex YloA/Tae2 family protein|nr:NFACT family protein [Pyrinomonadaceae bacterium]
MNDALISEVTGEVARELKGQTLVRTFQLSSLALALDFRPGGRALLLAAEPNRPRIHLVARTARELERESVPPTPFAHALRKHLGGGRIEAVTKDEGERVVRLHFKVPDAVGDEHALSLVAQLTGRAANLFVLDGAGRVLDSLRPARGAGQETGETYAPPPQSSPAKGQRGQLSFVREGARTLSEALDRHFREEDRARAFDSRASAVMSGLRREIARLGKLRDNLSRDLAAHGDADEHKKLGDLLLANLGTAERRGSTVRLLDFYADDAPHIELEVEENKSLQDEAASRFARYTKAKRAAREINERLAAVSLELDALEARRAELERIVEERDDEALSALTGGDKAAQKKGAPKAKSQKKAPEGLQGIRRYRSSDGHEILVGRGPRENDHLTFRVARSYDTWLHAADYPGSHVVVRARSRDEQIPHRTLLEAARLAANFSKARKDSKVAVNYTQRKFISKPKGAAPGLVYLSSFRTLLVEPGEDLERL